MAGAKSRPQSQRRGVRERGDPFATTGCLRPKPVHPLLTLRLQTPRLTSAPSTSRPRASLPAPPEAEVADRSPETAEAALEFFASLPGPERQRALMPELLRLVQLSLYIQPNFSSASLSAPMCPTRQVLFFVGHRWLASRLLQLKRKSLHMSEVVRRCMRFENIRVQVQANLMELGAKRPVVEVSSSILRRRQTAKEEREETPPPKLKDPAADKFAQQLSAGRAGKSSLIWLWALWKHVHALLMRRRRKKGELLERTLVGDLAAPFRHWMIFAVESKTESKMITYTTYLQERQMYTRTAMDLHNKKEDLVLDIQVSENSCVRLEKQLEAKRQNRAQLAQRLLDVRPDMVKAMLSKVLDLTLLEVLRMGYLFRTLYRLHFLTRDLAPLLLAEEDSAWRLFGLSGDQILARWVNSQLAQFKLVANEVLEAMSKRSQDEEADIEWSARETEVYGDRCRALRAMKPVTAAEPDADAALAMAYGAVCAKEALHPVSMWPLDAKEDKASALCAAIRQVIPTAAKFLLLPGDLAKSQVPVIPSVLAVVFVANETLPCAASHGREVLGAAAFAASAAAQMAQAAALEPRKSGSKHKELAMAVSDLPDMPEEHRAQDLHRRVVSWLEDAELPSQSAELPTERDPVLKTIFSAIEQRAGAWAIDTPQDFTKLLKPEEGPSDLGLLPAHELLLRWVNFQLAGVTHGVLQNLGEVEGAPVVLEVLNKVAPDVLPLQAEEQAAVRQAASPAATEAATEHLVVALARRCVGYPILTEEVLRDDQADVVAAFLAELMACRPNLPIAEDSEQRNHMDLLAEVVLEAAKTEQSGLQQLCGYLRQTHGSITTSLEEMRKHRETSEAVKDKLRSFALKMLVKRSQGAPCNMLELAQQLPKNGPRGDLISSSLTKATIHREMTRLMAQQENGRISKELVMNSEKSAVEELLKRHISVFRDSFRHYARGSRSEPKPAEPVPAGRKMSISGEAAQVLVVSQRYFMMMYRDCRLHQLRLSPLDMEEVYNEVKLHHMMAAHESPLLAMAEDSQRFEQGLSLELFVEALLTLACRAKIEGLAPTAIHDKLSHVIENHIVPLAGTKREDFVYQLLVDESLDELLDEWSARLRSIFTAYASSARKVERDRHRHRGAFIESTGVQSQKQALCMSLESFTEMLEHARLSAQINRARVGSIFRGLVELQKREQKTETEQEAEQEVEEPTISRSMQEDPNRVANLLQDDSGASFQYVMAFQEFLDGLIILTLFKEPNPFISFVTRFERFIRNAFVEPLFEHAGNSQEPRLVTLYEALEDAFQKDVSIEGISRKLKKAEVSA